ncbi:MAG: glycosyltransferase family 4 protein [bacterium]
MNKENKKNVMFIGVGYFPYITAGEKNFYCQMIDLLVKTEKVKAEVISINDQDVPIYIQKTGKEEVMIHNLKRPFHLYRKRFYRRINDKIYYHHEHKQPREMIERFLTIVWYEKYISEIIKKSNIGVIHFMDNFGLVMPHLKKKYPHIKMTYSPASYNPRGKFYDNYLKLSFKKLDRLFPFTKAYKEILFDIGISPKTMEVIHWGVKMPKKRLSFEEKNAIKMKYGCSVKNKLFLWSGRIQQIQEDDFYRAVDSAKEVVQKCDDIEFIFAFKPESYKTKYIKKACQKVQIITNVDEFNKLLESADVFFSPVGKKESTVAPPLTWIEAMSMGTPVMTTGVRGGGELIEDGETGFVVDDYSDIISKCIEVKSFNLNIISNKAREFVAEEFNIEKICEEYLKNWEALYGGQE